MTSKLLKWDGKTVIQHADCKKGRVYEIQSRNLSYGVFDGKYGFIGIREKFGNRYLFTEYHYEQGAPFGTVTPFRDTGIDVPNEITVADGLGSVDETTGRMIEHDNTIDNPNPSMKGSKGWWRFVDTKEPCPPVTVKDSSGKESHGTHAMGVSNTALFKFLEAVESGKCQ